MISAALADGTAHRPCVFEVFARRLHSGRRYGVVGGTGRLLDRLADFRFTEDEIAVVADSLDERTIRWLRDFRFTGDIDGYREGELYFPGSPVLSIRGASPNVWCSRRWCSPCSTTTARSLRPPPA